MPDLDVDVLLIGGGIASATAAATLREEGFDGSVLLVGREPTLPYHRPPASKEYLRGDAQADETLVHPAGWFDEHAVDARTRTLLRELDTVMRRSGGSLDAYLQLSGESAETLVARLREQAAASVAGEMLLEAAADELGVAVSDAEAPWATGCGAS